MIAVVVEESIACFAFLAVEALVIFDAVGEVEDAVVSVEVHAFWALGAEIAVPLLAALRAGEVGE